MAHPIDEARAEGVRLATLAWPVMLAQLGMVSMGAVDLLMVGRLGEAATASLGLGNTYSFGLVVLAIGAAQGIDPLVTQAYGAGLPREAGRAGLQGLGLVGLLAVPLTALHTVAPTVLTALGQPSELLPLADTYCTVLALGVPPFAAFAVLRQWLQGDGVMKPAMVVIGLGNLVNVAGNLVLIDRLGVAGVAWSTVIVRWVMVGALVALTWRTLARAWPVRSIWSGAAFVRLAALSLPVAVQTGLEIWAFATAALLAGGLGATAIAAHVVALNVVALAFMIANGLSAAAATRVGNLVGAGRPWRTAAVTALALVVGVMTCTGVTIGTFPTLVGRLYSPDPDVVALVATVLPIGAAFGLFDGLQVVAFGILRGLGDTRLPSTFNLIGYWVLGLPLGALLVSQTNLGLRGIWIGLAVSLVVVTTLLGLRILWHARGVQRFTPGDPPGKFSREPGKFPTHPETEIPSP